MEDISEAIAQACHAHSQGDGAVLMVVQQGEKNSYDQQVGIMLLDLHLFAV